MRTRNILAVLAITLSLTVSACAGGGVLAPSATPDECTAEDVQAFLDELEPILDRWDDRAKLTGVTDRTNLVPIVSDLQDLKHAVQELGAPRCAEEAQYKAVAYMDQYIDSHLARMALAGGPTVSAEFARADALLTDFKEARRALRVNYRD